MHLLSPYVTRRLALLMLMISAITVTPVIAQSMPSGERLRTLAPLDLGIGGVVHGYWPPTIPAGYQRTAEREFSAVTVTAYMAYGGWPNPAAPPDVSGLNRITNWALNNGQRVHGHVLVYPAANLQLEWFQALDNDQVEARLRRFVTTMARQTAGRMWVWDVVNEALGDEYELETGNGVDEDGLRKGLMINETWHPYKEYEAMGPDYIAKAFYWADRADPKARLIINDYAAEPVNAKSNALYALVKKLLAQGVPIDGVGFQMHWMDTASEPDYASIARNFKRFADLGLELYITEADVAATRTYSPTSEPPSAADLERQARVFGNLLQLALEQPAVKAFLLWDFADDQSWLHPDVHNPADSGEVPYYFPTPFWGGGDDGKHQITPKPAYYRMQKVLKAFKTRYRLKAGWDPESAWLAREGVPGSNGGFTPGSTVALFSLDQETQTWGSLKWNFRRVSGDRFIITNYWGTDSGRLTHHTDFDRAGWQPGTGIGLMRASAGTRGQRWQLEPSPTGGFRIYSNDSYTYRYLTRDGYALGADQYAADRTVSAYERQNWSSQIWELERTSE